MSRRTATQSIQEAPRKEGAAGPTSLPRADESAHAHAPSVHAEAQIRGRRHGDTAALAPNRLREWARAHPSTTRVRSRALVHWRRR